MEWLTYLRDHLGIKSILSVLVSLATLLWGQPDTLLIALVVLMGLDLVSKVLVIVHQHGLLSAIRQGHLRSRVGIRKTLTKFVRYGITMAAVYQLASMVPASLTLYGFEIRWWLRFTGYAYLAIQEVVSILENLMGVNGDDLQPMKEALDPKENRALHRMVNALIDRLENFIAGR